MPDFIPFDTPGPFGAPKTKPLFPPLSPEVPTSNPTGVQLIPFDNPLYQPKTSEDAFRAFYPETYDKLKAQNPNDPEFSDEFKLTTFLAEQLNIPIEYVWNHRPEVTETYFGSRLPTKDALSAIADGYHNTVINSQISALFAKRGASNVDVEDPLFEAAVAVLKAKLAPEDTVERPFVTQALKSAANLVGSMSAMVPMGLKGAAVGFLTSTPAAAIALAAQNPPLALKFAVSGTMKGFTVGSSIANGIIEGGSVIRTIVELGDKYDVDRSVSFKIARVPGLIVGLVNSALELVGLSQAPGIKELLSYSSGKLLKEIGSASVMTALTKAGIKGMVKWSLLSAAEQAAEGQLTNILQEVLQEVSSIIGETFGIQMMNAATEKNIQGYSSDEIKKRLTDTLVQTGEAALVFFPVGVVTGTAKGVFDARQQINASIAETTKGTGVDEILGKVEQEAKAKEAAKTGATPATETATPATNAPTSAVDPYHDENGKLKFNIQNTTQQAPGVLTSFLVVGDAENRTRAGYVKFAVDGEEISVVEVDQASSPELKMDMIRSLMARYPGSKFTWDAETDDDADVKASLQEEAAQTNPAAQEDAENIQPYIEASQPTPERDRWRDAAMEKAVIPKRDADILVGLMEKFADTTGVPREEIFSKFTDPAIKAGPITIPGAQEAIANLPVGVKAVGALGINVDGEEKSALLIRQLAESSQKIAKYTVYYSDKPGGTDILLHELVHFFTLLGLNEGQKKIAEKLVGKKFEEWTPTELEKLAYTVQDYTPAILREMDDESLSPEENGFLRNIWNFVVNAAQKVYSIVAKTSVPESAKFVGSLFGFDEATVARLGKSMGNRETAVSDSLLLSQKAYHGTGSEFDEFDSSYMGSGEGSQLFGWGHYLTDNEGIARTYASEAGGRKSGYLIDGVKVIDDPNGYMLEDGGEANKFQKDVIRYYHEAIIDNKTGDNIADAINTLKVDIEWQEKHDMEKDVIENTKKILRVFQDGKFEEFEGPRYIYNAVINPQGEDVWLDWDQVITPEKWKMVSDKVYEKGLITKFEPMRKSYHEGFLKGEYLYWFIAKKLVGDPKGASLFLADAGFTGIRYPASSLSGGEVEGTNFVVARDDMISIVSKIPFALKIDTPEFKEWFGDSKVVDENGDPLVVYHGSRKTFDNFQATRYADGSISFSITPDLANSYPVGTGGHRVPEYDTTATYREMYDRQNELAKEYGVYTLDEKDPDWLEKIDSIKKEIESKLMDEYGFKSPYEYESHVGMQLYPVYLSVQKLFDPRKDWKEIEDFLISSEFLSRESIKQEYHKSGNWLIYEDKRIVDELKRMGYDGVRISETIGGPHDTINVFSPTQIKSIFNRGTWDASDPRLLFAKRLTPEEKAKREQDKEERQKIRSARHMEIVAREKAKEQERQRVQAVLESEVSQNILKYLTPGERQKVNRRNIEAIIELFEKLGDPTDIALVALSAVDKRGWYRKSAKAIAAIFGIDTRRFTALLAALSPMNSVETNLLNALNTWKNWILAGRPTDASVILEIMGKSVQGTKGLDSVLPAWRNNAITALTDADPLTTVLSGPKVDSFSRNLTMEFCNYLNYVTLDTWMARVYNIKQAVFAGSKNKAGNDPGYRTGYLAATSHLRVAAEAASILTGDEWKPAEIQETVWSWGKLLVELSKLKGERRTPAEILMSGQVTGDMIANIPSFADLFQKEVYASILEKAGYKGALNDLRNTDISGSTEGGPGRGPGVYGPRSITEVPEGIGISQRTFESALKRIADNFVKGIKLNPDELDPTIDPDAPKRRRKKKAVAVVATEEVNPPIAFSLKYEQAAEENLSIGTDIIELARDFDNWQMFRDSFTTETDQDETYKKIWELAHENPESTDINTKLKRIWSQVENSEGEEFAQSLDPRVLGAAGYVGTNQKIPPAILKPLMAAIENDPSILDVSENGEIPLPPGVDRYSITERMKIATLIEDPELRELVMSGKLTNEDIESQERILKARIEESVKKLQFTKTKEREAYASLTPQEKEALDLKKSIDKETLRLSGLQTRLNKSLDAGKLDQRLITEVNHSQGVLSRLQDDYDNLPKQLRLAIESSAIEDLDNLDLTAEDRIEREKRLTYGKTKIAELEYRDLIKQRDLLRKIREMRDRLLDQVTNVPKSVDIYFGRALGILGDIMSGKEVPAEKWKAFEDFIFQSPAAYLFDEDTMKMLKESGIKAWTMSEMEHLYDVVRILQKIGRQSRSVVVQGERDLRKQMIEEGVLTITDGKPVKQPSGAVKKSRARDIERIADGRPRDLANLLDGDKPKFFTKLMMDTVNAQDNAYMRATDARKEPMFKAMDDAKITISPLDLRIPLNGYTFLYKTYDIEDPSGGKNYRKSNGTKVTLDDLLFFYIGMKNKKVADALLYGCNYPQFVLDSAEKLLTPEQKKFADTVTSDHNSHFREFHDAVARAFNTDIPEEQFYVMMVRLKDSFKARDDEVASDVVGRTGDSRTFMARNPSYERINIDPDHQSPIRTDFLGVTLKGIEIQEGFIHKDMMIKRMHAVLGNREVRWAIQDKFGQQIVDALDEYTNRLANPNLYAVTTVADKIMATIRSGIFVSSLGINPVPIMKQSVSILPFLSEAGPAYILSASGQWLAANRSLDSQGRFLPGVRNSMIDFVESKSMKFKHRVMSREQQEWRQYSPQTSGSALGVAFDRFSRVSTKVGSIVMHPYEIMDHVSVAIGWKAVYDRWMAKDDSAAGEKVAIEKADYAMEKGQPSTFVQDTPQMFFGSEGNKWWTMFTRSPVALYDIVRYDIPREIKNRQGWKVAADFAAISIGATVIAIIGGALYGGDDEEKKRKLIRGFAGELFNLIPYIGSVTSRFIATGKVFGTLGPLTAVQPILEGAGHISKEEWEEAFSDALVAFGYVAHLPVSGPRKALKVIQSGDPKDLMGW